MMNYSQMNRLHTLRKLSLLLMLTLLLTGCGVFDGSYSVEEDFPLAAALYSLVPISHLYVLSEPKNNVSVTLS